MTDAQVLAIIRELARSLKARMDEYERIDAEADFEANTEGYSAWNKLDGRKRSLVELMQSIQDEIAFTALKLVGE